MSKQNLTYAVCLVFLAVSPVVAAGPVTDLSCNAASGSSDVHLQWTNDGPYIGIEIRANGHVVATLAGTETSVTVPSLSPGRYGFCVEPYDAAGVVEQTCCVETVGTLPFQLVCGTIIGSSQWFVSWTNGSSYTSIRIFVNGLFDAEVPGTATQHTVFGLAPGTHLIEVRALVGGTVVGVNFCGATVWAGAAFVRGDCNGDTVFNIADPVALLGHTFLGAALDCRDACDSNDDGSLNLGDVVHALFALFSNGPDPEAPFPTCATDPTVDSLPCLSYAGC